MFFISAYFLQTLASAAPLAVVVDPGHGGADHGAVRQGLKESEIALKISLELAERLKKDPAFKVTLTRSQDESLTLYERTAIADRVKADLFLSIHCNSSEDPRAAGPEIWFQNQLPVDEEALFFANRENQEGADEHRTSVDEQISTQTDLLRILEDLQRNNRLSLSHELSKILITQLQKAGTKHNTRAIRQAPFHVVTLINIPSVLVETGFITHRHEGPRLADPAYQKEFAENLYIGLTKYKEKIDKERAASLNSAHAL